PDLIQSLAKNTGIDPQFCPSGLVMLEESEKEKGQRWAEDHGREIETWDRKTLRERVPGVGDYEDAFHLPWVGQVRNPRLAKALAAELEAGGAELCCDTEVTGIRSSAARVTGVDTSDGPIHA